MLADLINVHRFAVAAGVVLVLLATVAGVIVFNSPEAPQPLGSVYKPSRDVGLCGVT